MKIPLAAPLVLAVAVLAAPRSESGPGPTLAREDTMHTEVPEVLVQAPRVTLNEILDRVARGEARRDSMLSDQSFTATFRIVRSAEKDKPARLMEERVFRIYKKRPKRIRSVLLRQWKEKPSKRVEANIDFRPDMSEEIVNFAFQPAARRDYRYRIVGRDIVGNHLIYRIAFDPKSPLGREPSGLVWVDTNDFVIVRQEVRFDRSPMPVFIKGVDRMVIERQRAEGHWVLASILLRARMTVPLPSVGHAFDMAIHYDQYAINRGLSDSLFVGAAGRP